jgi:hypothetical protein
MSQPNRPVHVKSDGIRSAMIDHRDHAADDPVVTGAAVLCHKSGYTTHKG